MHKNVFSSSIAVVLLGEHTVCNHVGVKLTQMFDRTHHIDMTGTLADINRANELKDRITRRFHLGMRMYVITGFPQTVTEAIVLREILPHRVTFSVEKDRVHQSTLQEIKRELAKQSQVHLVHPDKKPARFIQNRIEEVLKWTKMAHDATSLVKTPALSVA